jgi:lysophospholipase L1-like esterase
MKLDDIMIHDTSIQCRFARMLVTVSLAVSAVLSILLLFSDLVWLWFLFALAFLTAYCLLAIKKQIGGKLICRLMLVTAVVVFILVIPELILRLVDFSYQGSLHYQGGEKFATLRPETRSLFVPDDRLYWKLPSSQPNVNSYGFPDHEIAVPKPPGTYRIIYLGDSVTQLGYPRFAEQLLNRLLGRDNIIIESVIMAVAGYSSYQGRVMADMYAEKFDPDLAVVLFGWNDHWLACNAIDSEAGGGRFNWLIRKVYLHSRLIQLAGRLAEPLMSDRKSRIIDRTRVPIDEYTANLDAIAMRCEKSAVPVLLVTSPTSHYRLTVPDYLVRDRYAYSRDSVIMLHKRYNKSVREVAENRDLYLLDLERIIDTRKDIGELFSADGIHPNRRGIELIAEIIGQYIYQHILPDSLISGEGD